MAVSVNPKTVLVNGVALHYIENGSGAPVIFVHGSLGDYRTWMPQFEPFAQNFRAISYSRRYHYPNAWVGDGKDYTVGLHADDLIAMIEALNLDPVNVIGNSFGAYTALIAGLRRPDLIRRLVIGEPPILPWLQEIPDGKIYWDDFMKNAWIPASQAFQNGNLEEGVRLFLEGVSGKGTFEHIPDTVKSRIMENARSLAAETVSPGYFTEITPQQAGNIPVPILLLKGEHSPKMFHLIVDYLAQSASHAQQATIPDASHSMASNNPQMYNQIVLGFLQGD